MPQAIEDDNSANRLETTQNIEGGDNVRHKMRQLLGDEDFQKTLNSEAIQGYRDMVEKKGHIDPNDTEHLSRFYDFMKRQYEQVQQAKHQMGGKLEQAQQEKIISEGDRVYFEKLLKTELFSGKQIVTQVVLNKAEQKISDGLGKCRKDFATYNRIKDDPRFRNGVLQAKGKEPIPIPDWQAVLDMPLKERRAFLEKIRKTLNLPLVGKRRSSPEEIRLGQKYRELLEAAKKDGILGAESIRLKMKQFNALEGSEKTKKADNLESELAPFRKLWADIRKNLSAPSIKSLEKVRDELDDPKLTAEYKRFYSAEEKGVAREYRQKLQATEQKQILNPSMQQEIKGDFEKMTLADKRLKLNSFEKELGRFKNLRQNIDEIEEPALRRALDSLYRENKSFSEISAAKEKKLEEQRQKEEKEAAKNTRIQSEISSVQGGRKQQKMLEATEEEPDSANRSFFGRLQQMFSGEKSQVTSDSFDEGIRKARAERNKAEINETDQLSAKQRDQMKSEAEAAAKIKPRLSATSAEADKKALKDLQKSGQQDGRQPLKMNQRGTYVEAAFDKGAVGGRRSRIINVVLSDQEGRNTFNAQQTPDMQKDAVVFKTGLTKEDQNYTWADMKKLTKVWNIKNEQ